MVAIEYDNVIQTFPSNRADQPFGVSHENVIWANGMEGGHVYGRDGVRDYWTRQWAMIDPRVDPIDFADGPGGELIVEVHAVVCDLNGNVLKDVMVGHVFRIENGLVERFDISDSNLPAEE